MNRKELEDMREVVDVSFNKKLLSYLDYLTVRNSIKNLESNYVSLKRSINDLKRKANYSKIERRSYISFLIFVLSLFLAFSLFYFHIDYVAKNTANIFVAVFLVLVGYVALLLFLYAVLYFLLTKTSFYQFFGDLE
jgi:hypothetical protein